MDSKISSERAESTKNHPQKQGGEEEKGAILKGLTKFASLHGIESVALSKSLGIDISREK